MKKLVALLAFILPIQAFSGSPIIWFGDYAKLLAPSGLLDASGNLISGASGIASKTTTYTATVSDDNLLVDGSGGGWTLTLPSASARTGKVFWIIRTDDTPANAVTVDAHLSQTIGGATTRALYTKGEILSIVSDGSNWQIRSHECDTSWASFTPTGSWSTNTTYSGMMRRSKDGAEFVIQLALAGAPTATALTVNLPVTIDTAKVPGDTRRYGDVLLAAGGYGSTQRGLGYVYHNTTTAVSVGVLDDAAGTADLRALTHNDPAVLGNGDRVVLRFAVPVSGWWK